MDLLRSRVIKIGDKGVTYSPQSVVYVAGRDLRTTDNFALLAAQAHALKAKLPLIVLFVAYDKRVGQRSREQMEFLLDGLEDLEVLLTKHDVSFVIQAGQPLAVWQQAVTSWQPAAIYFDFSPLRGLRTARRSFASNAQCPVFVVDAHNIVPVWVASDKCEFAARTIRPKIQRHLPDYLQNDLSLQKHPYVYQSTLNGLNVAAVKKKILPLYPSSDVDISRFEPGQLAGERAITDFISHRLKNYKELRNKPNEDNLSNLSPYLHYGFIGSLQVVAAAYEALKDDPNLQIDVDTIVEEMVVRKELSDNFCYYNPNYDKLVGAPEWAQKTLAKHATDPREFTYSREQFELASTHDQAWNAAQKQLTRTGKMHGYMRMYWAKKVLEWSASPQDALDTLLYLNDFYHLDGGDPNGYVGIMWSIAGVHDRPWGERPVYGVIRSMVYNGLKRKFDIQAYIDQYA